MRRRTLPVSRPTVPTIGGRSLAYVPWPWALLARRRGGSAGSRCGSLFSPRVLIQLIRFGLLIFIERIIRLQRKGIGLQLLADNLHRLAAHSDFVRQDLRLLAFDHAAHQQDDLLRLQVSAFKDRLAVHVEGLVTHATPIVRHLATFGYSKRARLFKTRSTMRTRQPARMKAIQQPGVTALARQQLHDGKLNWHDPPLSPACSEFTTPCTCSLHEPILFTI